MTTQAEGSNTRQGATQDPARVGQEAIPAVYDRLAPVYDVWSALTESKSRGAALQHARIVDGEDVLEIAVGTGKTLGAIARKNPHGTIRGIDLSPGMVSKAKRRMANHSGCSGVEITQGDAHALPYSDDSFDLVVVSYLFDLLPEHDFPGVIEEIRRVVRPTGRVVATNMTIAQRRRDDLYRWVYRLQPKLMDGCRGVRLTTFLVDGGFRVEHRDYVAQLGFPSEILLARPNATTLTT
jgi:demethylmenaquinone methyltransferase / 2-methoxy-6-polyprenyl-1,4-benzoquinol methylase